MPFLVTSDNCLSCRFTTGISSCFSISSLSLFQQLLLLRYIMTSHHSLENLYFIWIGTRLKNGKAGCRLVTLIISSHSPSFCDWKTFNCETPRLGKFKSAWIDMVWYKHNVILVWTFLSDLLIIQLLWCNCKTIVLFWYCYHLRCDAFIVVSLFLGSQVLFLMYHYFAASEIYNAIRVFIAAYVWMTGFGNFSYYYVRKDFSLVRFAQVCLFLEL